MRVAAGVVLVLAVALWADGTGVHATTIHRLKDMASRTLGARDSTDVSPPTSMEPAELMGPPPANVVLQADFYKYPSHVNGWRDSTGCTYSRYEWGGATKGLGTGGTRDYNWGRCTILSNAPVGPNAPKGLGYTFYHSSAASASDTSGRQVNAPMTWTANAMPHRPLWMTVDLEQSVGIAAKEAAEMKYEIEQQKPAPGNNKRKYEKARAPVEVWVYTIRIGRGQTLRLFPLPPCKCAGRDLLNAYITYELEQRMAADGQWKAKHGVAVKKFSKALLGVNMDMSTDEGTALLLLCKLFETQPVQSYDGWRSPWDQDEIMICPHAIPKLEIPDMIHQGRAHAWGHGNGKIRRCPATVWYDRFAVVPTTEQNKMANAVTVRGRLEKYSNWYAKQVTPEMTHDTVEHVFGDPTKGSASLPAAAVLTGNTIGQHAFASPFPPRFAPANCKCTGGNVPDHPDAFRYAFYYRTTRVPGTGDASGAPFKESDLTADPNGCPALA